MAKRNNALYEGYIPIDEKIIAEVEEAVEYSSKRYVASRIFGYSSRTSGAVINKIVAHEQYQMRIDSYDRLKIFLEEERNKVNKS